MFIDRKIQSLPNWQQQAYGDLKIFDNNLLISDDFSEDQSLVNNTENLIGPVDLKFDLTNFQDNQLRKWITTEKYIWDFWDETLETFAPSVNKTFNSVWNYEIKITAVWRDVQWEEVIQELADVPPISLSHNIEIEETITSIGWKILTFDASSLSNLWEIDWYLYEPETATNTQPRYPNWEKTQTWYEFLPSIIFFEEAYVWIMIRSWSEEKESFDKIIRIANEVVSNISWEITFRQSPENELLYNFYVDAPETDFWNGFIEKYQWSIENKTYNSISALWDNTASPEIEHVFTEFWDQEVSVTLTDSAWNSQTIRKTITIQKKVKLQSPLLISNDWDEIENLKYEENTHEYFIDDFWVPGVISLDARRVRPVNILYVLDWVSWDISGDGNIDGTGKTFNYEVPTEWSHTIVAEYRFQHRRTADDVIILKESIFIEWVKKEAILDLKFEYPSNYVPVTVRFDASASFIKNDDIVKFIYDYGDGIVEERDSINPWHRYSEPWNYIVKLTVLGKSWKSYSTEKSLILLPAAQIVKISTSLKKAPVWQGIDFSSAESAWQIVEYFWDFWDGNISTSANPTHSYKKAGVYTVELKADFANNNTIVDKIEVEIVQNDE